MFAELVAELPGYDFILSDATSNPLGDGVKQKVGFIYNTATVTPKSTRALFKSIHPLYNGGDATAISDYPDGATDRFYASGRLPFLLTADVTINGKTEEIDLIALHARANNSANAQERYDFRKYDVGVLKDSLDANFSTRNVMVLGDYNDDVDQTVADVTTTVSTYQNFVEDMVNYTIVTSTLSEQGFRSFVSRENMIDHILISDELDDNFVENSAAVGYQFYTATYDRTVSDHFPVSARFVIGDQEEARIERFNLINASTNTIAGSLVDGQVLSLADIGTRYLSIEAVTTAPFGSLLMELEGPVSFSRIENVAPYTLFGDQNNNFFGKVLTPGRYTITATAFDGKNRSGASVSTSSINFTITDRLPIVIAPNPIQNDEIVVYFPVLTKNTLVDYTLINQMGLLVSSGSFEIATGSTSATFDATDTLVEKGLYYLILIIDGEQFTLKVQK